MNPKVSIIIPNYNHEAFLVQRLESVFNQTFQDFEVILLDDKSSDGSVMILEQYARRSKVSHFIINEKNSGSPFKQWQKGIQLAKGEYIWIAESDDYCEITFLCKLIKFTVENPLVGIVYCQTYDVDEKGGHLGHRINYTSRFQPNIWESDFVICGYEFVKFYFSFFNVIPNASAVIFKKKLIKDSIFSALLVDMKMCGDWYFWIQIALSSKVGFLSETLNYFREHHSVSRNHNDIYKKKLRLLEEKKVRSFMHSLKILNSPSEFFLYFKWFDLHDYRAIFTKSFYRVKLKNISFFAFLKLYSKNKLTLRKLKENLRFYANWMIWKLKKIG